MLLPLHIGKHEMRRVLVFIETHMVLSGQDTVEFYFHSYQPEFIQSTAATENHPKTVKIIITIAIARFFLSSYMSNSLTKSVSLTVFTRHSLI